MHSQSSIDVKQPQKTGGIHMIPEQRKQASEGRSITRFDHKLIFEKSKKETHHKWEEDVNEEYVKECKGYEWITKVFFDGHVKDITLKVRIEDCKTCKRNDQILPCDVVEIGCES